jgi:hypothetical protein
MYQSQHDGDWSPVADVIENWKATANIEANPAVVAGIEQGLAELEEGQGRHVLAPLTCHRAE